MLPCIPIYLKEDMTIRQVLWQRGIELVVLEIAMCLAVRFLMGDAFPKAGYAAILFLLVATICQFINASMYLTGMLLAGMLCCLGVYFNER